MQHFRCLRQWLGVMAACMFLWPAVASAADTPVMSARLHVVKGYLALEPGSVQFSLGQWVDEYDAQCGITEADLHGRIIAHANATLKARGNVLEQFALGGRQEKPELAAAQEVARSALLRLVESDKASGELHQLTAPWGDAVTRLSIWFSTAQHLSPKPVHGGSVTMHVRVLMPAVVDSAWNDSVAAPPVTLKARLASNQLSQSGHFELQPAPPFRANKPKAKLRLKSNVSEWAADKDRLQRHLVEPFDCQLAPQAKMSQRAKDYFEIRGVTLEQFRLKGENQMPEPDFNAGIELRKQSFNAMGFGGRVLLSSDPAIDALYIQADPEKQGSLVRRVLYQLLPTRDWDLVRAPAFYLCRIKEFGPAKTTMVYLDFRSAAARGLEFSKGFLTRAAVAERLRRLVDVGYQVNLDYPSAQTTQRRKGASLVVSPKTDTEKFGKGELRIPDCPAQADGAMPAPAPAADDEDEDERENSAEDVTKPAAKPVPKPVTEFDKPAGVQRSHDKDPLRVKEEPRNHLRIGAESDGSRRPRFTASYVRGGIADEHVFLVSTSHQGRPSGNIEYGVDFLGFDHGIDRRVQFAARAFTDYDPDRPTSNAPEDLRRSGVELRLTTDLWRDWAGSFGQATASLTQHDTWQEGTAEPKDRIRKATAGFVFARTEYATAASPHVDGGMSLTQGRARPGSSFRKAEGDITLHRFTGAFYRWDLRAATAYVSKTAPQSEWPVFGGEASLRGYASDTTIARRTWVIQNELWLPVSELLQRDTEFTSFLRRSVWLAVLVDVGGLESSPRLANGSRRSAGLGLRFAQGSDFTLRLDWARPIGENDARVDRSGNWIFSVTTRRSL